MLDHTNLPNDFPTQMTTTFFEGEHKGRRQFSNTFEHAGKRYKLVVTGGVYPVVGYAYTVYPQNSPNGHIVFCTLHQVHEEEDIWSNDDDFDLDAHRERQEELYYERLERYED